ncbi:unnamed protein product, partial [Brenthis ino]
MTETQMEQAKNEYMENLKKLTSDRDSIERSTTLQRDSSEWLEIRQKLITASNFGSICKRKLSSNTAPLVKNILYKNNLAHVASIVHGVENEHQALLQLQRQENVNILPCGLFIDKSHCYIGVTPDGLIGTDTIVEIKCPMTASKQGLVKAIEENKIQIIKYNKKTMTKTIKKIVIGSTKSKDNFISQDGVCVSLGSGQERMSLYIHSALKKMTNSGKKIWSQS